jgi:MFS transporter, putative metabolite:H+ symporter
MAEFLPPRHRGRWLVALEGFWAIGTILVALAAWGASLWAGEQAWRWLFVLTALPAAVGFWLRLWLPESPHYLMHRGQPEQARLVLDRIARSNGVETAQWNLAASPQRRSRMLELFPVGCGGAAC